MATAFQNRWNGRWANLRAMLGPFFYPITSIVVYAFIQTVFPVIGIPTPLESVLSAGMNSSETHGFPTFD